MSEFPPVILLMGPTAMGKTDLAVALAEFFPLEIISVDSALVYRGMDVGTAKPSLEIRAQVPHHLIDICDPAEAYSAAQFCNDAEKLISQIFSRGHLPLLVGGTMMYYRALTQGLCALPAADLHTRAKLDEQARERGWPYLHAELARIDAETAARLHPNDAQRIQRALEIYLLTEKPLSVHLADQQVHSPYQYHALGLLPSDRSILHQRIAQRFGCMLREGLLEEVQHLMQRGDLNLNMPALRSVGYRQVWQGLIEHHSLSEIEARGTAATRQLAKRQITWMKSWPNLSSIDGLSPDCLHTVHQVLAERWTT